MEEYVALLIPAMLAVITVRIMLLPIRFLWKIGTHSGCGFLCLWLLNTISPFTGIFLPINAVTVLISGFLGLPGIGLLALLAVTG